MFEKVIDWVCKVLETRLSGAILRKIVLALWTSLMTVGLAAACFDEKTWNDIAFVCSGMDWWVFVQNFVVLTIVATIAILLNRTHWIMRWSWISLFYSKKEIEKAEQKGQPTGGNVYLEPMYIRYSGLVLMLLLFINLPSIVLLEEKLFREGTEGWIHGIVWSLIFGFSHCLAGVPVSAGTAITFSGLWFTYQYFIGGVERSAAHHCAYNVIALGALAIVLIVLHFVPKEENDDNETGDKAEKIDD
jgi:hypothetical protein